MEKEHYHHTARLQSDHWWYEGRRNIFTDILTRLGIAENSRILEAGCGPGANLKMLQAFGAVSGFDPDDFAVQHACECSKAEVETGNLPDNIPYDGPFDLVGAFDVIEHIEDDLGALQALQNKMEVDGYALFTVPAHQWLWSRHDDINHHKRRYSLAQFRKVLEAAGYDIQKISYYNMWLFPLAVSVRFLKKLLNREDVADVSMPSGPVNKVLRWIFASEGYILRHMNLPFGLSIIAVCKKK